MISVFQNVFPFLCSAQKITFHEPSLRLTVYYEAEWYYGRVYMREGGQLIPQDHLMNTFHSYPNGPSAAQALPGKSTEDLGRPFSSSLLLFLLRCARGLARKPIKERFMFIKGLSKLKNFLINGDVAAAPPWLGVSPQRQRLRASYNSRLGICWWLH